MVSQSMIAVVAGAALCIPVATVATGSTAEPEIRVVAGAVDDHSGFEVTGEGSRPEELAAIDFVDLTVIEESLYVRSSDGFITVYGEVRNDSDRTVYALSLQVVALDGEGELLDTARRSIPASSPAEPWNATADLMTPGATAFFSATLGASLDAGGTILVRATGIEIDAVPGDLPLELVGEWDVHEFPPLIWLSGIVRNPTAQSIAGLRVTVAVRAPSGEVLDVQWVYPQASVIGGYLGGLRPGEETNVGVTLAVDPSELETADLETVVTGRPYGGGTFRYGVVGIAHRQGIGGSVWRSSLTLTNRSGAPAGVAVRYQYDHRSAEASLVLDDGETFHRDDVVPAVFGVDGPSAGYIQITSSTPLTVTGRTLNARPEGSFGQALPVFTPEMTAELMGGGLLSGLRGGESFRSNIGLVNMGTNDCACRVRLFDSGGGLLREWASVALGPTYWRQLNDVMPVDAEVASAVVEPEFGCWMWSYASVIDAATGDPTTIVVEPDTVIDLSPSLWPGRGAVAGSWADQVVPEPSSP